MLIMVVMLCCGATALAAQGRSGGAPAGDRPAKPQPAGGTSSRVVVLELDQQTGALRPASDSDAKLIESLKGQTIRLKRPAQVQLRVVHTNTALYGIAITDTAQSVSEPPGNRDPGSVSGFLTMTHTFFAQALGGLTGPRTRGATVAKEPASVLPDSATTLAGATDSNLIRTWNVARLMERRLWATDSLYAGPRSIPYYRGHARLALQRMRDTTERPEMVAQAFRDSIALRRVGDEARQCQPIAGDTLGLSRRLTNHLTMLKALADSLDRGLRGRGFEQHPSFRDSLLEFRARADSSIHAGEMLTDSASVTEHLVTLITGACSHQESQHRPAVSGDVGQAFVVRVSRRSEVDVARVAVDLPVPATVTIKVLPPRPLVTPSVGLSLVVAPSASFPTFATRIPATGGSQSEIFQQDVFDARYSWGPTLGLSWRFLDWSNTRSALAVWLPEISALQTQGTSGFTGFALGSAISFHAVKLGGGMVWIQHSVLQGQNVGDKVPNKDFLQARKSYGHGQLYLSLSVFGVPAFFAK